MKSLTPEEWQAPNIPTLWTVKDIALHLSDGNQHTLSFSRDGYFGEQPPAIYSHGNLVIYLNQLTAGRTNATRRLSRQ